MDFTHLKNFMDRMARDRTPGNAVEVWLEGKKVFSYAAGYRDLEQRIPLTGDELYNIYSCSKLTTVTAGAQLLERGDILLTDPLYEYIPEFREMYIQTETGLKKAERSITLGDLFSMTAGFSYDLNAPGFQKAREVTGGAMDTVAVMGCVAQDPLLFEPGTHWNYSICHDVLAAVISVVSGKKFRDYVQENIFDPLDMKDSFYHHTPETLARTAEKYTFVPESGEISDIVEAQKKGAREAGSFKNTGKLNHMVLGPEYDSGGAGIITSVSDYAKLSAALAGFGLGANGQRILSKASVELLRTNRLTGQLLADLDWSHLAGCGYGLGVRTHEDPARSGLICGKGEFGWGGAAGASIIVDPDVGLGVFYAQHCLNPREEYYQPRLRNVVYTCL